MDHSSIIEYPESVVVDILEKAPIRVLHVDDETAFLKVAKQILEGQGAFQVDTACSVDEAIRKMKKKQYHAIVCDYIMPRKDGLEFLKKLRESGNDIPFIIFTGKSREKVAIEALNLGADGYFNKIGKPETVYSELAHAIRQTVKAKHERKALRALFGAFPVPTYIWRKIGEDFVLVDYNPAAFEITHGKVASCVGKKASEMYRDKPKIREELSRCYAEKTIIKREMFYEFTSTKEKKYLSVTYAFMPPDFVLVFTEDLTEKKSDEDALKESEERYRNLVENARDLILTTDLEGNITSVNGIIQTYGVDVSELVGRNLFDFLPREYSPQFMDHYKNLIQGKPVEGEFKIEFKGSLYYAEYKANPIIQHGQVVGIAAIVRDITERKKMENDLRESEEKFRLAFENAKDAIFWADPETGLIINCNKAAETLLEKNREEIVGHHQTEIHPPEKAEYYISMFKRHINQKEAIDEEAEIITKSGKIKAVHITATLTSVAGKPIIQGIFRDISDRKLTIQALQETQQKFKGLFLCNPEATVYVDPNFRILDINPRFEQLFGYRLKEVRGKRLLEVIVPEDKLEEGKMLDERAKKGYVYCDTVRKRKDGSLVFVSVSAAPIVVEGELIGYMGVYKDISELKKAQQQLEESQRHFQTLFNLIADPVAIVDGKGKILEVTKKAEEVTGFKRDELVGKNFLRIKIATAKSKAIMMENLLKRMMGMKLAPYEVEMLTKDGKKLPYEINAAKIEYKGKPADLVVFRDISERKRMEEKLWVVGTLTRHDVRNKLSVVAMNVYLARKKLPPNHEVMQHLSEIESTVNDVERIFDFARNYEMLGMEKLVNMNVEKTLEEAILLFPNLQDVEVVNECRGLTVLADSLLRQLFYNLIDNSLRHGMKVSRIRVYYEEPEKDQLNLVYEDNGVGILKAEKERIFKRSYLKRTVHGLYLIRKMCEVYGWDIKETGTPGKGAQFIISIPKTTKSGKECYKLH